MSDHSCHPDPIGAHLDEIDEMDERDRGDSRGSAYRNSHGEAGEAACKTERSGMGTHRLAGHRATDPPTFTHMSDGTPMGTLRLRVEVWNWFHGIVYGTIKGADAEDVL